jgi:hypothetical protein
MIINSITNFEIPCDECSNELIGLINLFYQSGPNDVVYVYRPSDN